MEELCLYILIMASMIIVEGERKKYHL